MRRAPSATSEQEPKTLSEGSESPAPAAEPEITPLSPRARATVDALVRAVLPTRPKPTEDLIRRVVDEVEVSISYLPPSAGIPFAAGLAALEWLAVLQAPGCSRFSRLDPDRATLYLHRWGGSLLSLQRDFFKAVKAMVMIAYYEQPEIMAHLDYDPQGFIEELKAKDGTRRD